MKRQISYFSKARASPIKVTVETPSGWFKLFFFFAQNAAMVWEGRRIIIKKKYYYDPGLIKHELGHIEQIEEKGWDRFRNRYVEMLVTQGYDGHPYEIDADKKAEGIVYEEVSTGTRH